MTSITDLQNALTTLLGASAKFWPGGKPKLDDYYEAYLWAETVEAARGKRWSVEFVNAGVSRDQFTFRMGPGVFNSSTPFSYAKFRIGLLAKGELHIGIRIRGISTVLHEFDVVGIDQHQANIARRDRTHPSHAATRLHIEAKFHKSDLSLGVGRGIVGLKADCPSIHPFLVSRAEGSDTMRTLIKHYGGTYVHNGFPTDTGISYLRHCLSAAIAKWR